MEHLKIITAQLAKTKLISGASILFTTDTPVGINDLFKVVYNDKILYFKATVVAAIDESYLSISAEQTGYYHNLMKMGGLDVRDLLNLPVEAVIDEETIKQVNTSSTYC